MTLGQVDPPYNVNVWGGLIIMYEDETMKCIIGLGNPGPKYERTRHNIGFMAVDALSDHIGFTINKQKYNCLYEIGSFAGDKIMLIKPQTFMNLSGEGVRPLIDYYKVDLANIAVIYDDLDLPVGKIRLRQKGGHGGHNGIRSLIDHLGTNEFKRIRLGIGRPEDRTPVVNYVLQPFAKTEEAAINDTIHETVRVCETWLKKSFQDAMNIFNNKNE